MDLKKVSLSVLAAVRYRSEKNYESDYGNMPRPCHNIAFMLKGRGEIFSDGGSFSINAGEALFIPKNTTYKAIWTGENEIIYHTIHFDFSPYCDPFSDKIAKVCAIVPEDSEAFYGKIKTVSETQYAQDERQFPALSAFYSILSETLAKAVVEEKEKCEDSVFPAVLKIQNDFTEKIKVEELAALCFLSPSRFYFLFKKHTGKSPIAYKNDLAVQRAAQMLVIDNEKSVEDIADELGFESAVYFRRVFKKATGKTPTDFRKSTAPV